MLRKTDRPGLGDPLEPGGDINAVAHQVAVAFLHHIADMDADAKTRCGVPAARRRIEFDAAAHSPGFLGRHERTIQASLKARNSASVISPEAMANSRCLPPVTWPAIGTLWGSSVRTRRADGSPSVSRRNVSDSVALPIAAKDHPNWANESNTLRVSRPMLVVVLKAWVIETNDTPCASNTSTILAKSESERVRRSTL